MAKDFLDGSLLAYSVTTGPHAERIHTLLERGVCVSVLALNAFASTARSKLAMTPKEVREALDALRTLCAEILPVNVDTHAEAMRVSSRYGCEISDAITIASALEAGS